MKFNERFKRIRETDERAPCHDCCNIGSDGCRRNFGSDCVLSGVVRMKETRNRGKGKTLLISAGIEIMLIICITAANLNPTPILYFIFYNLLYGLVFSLLIPLYCLYKENGAPASGRVLAEAGFKKPGIRQWDVLAAFVVFSVGGQLIPKMAVGEQIQWHLLPMGIVPLIMTTFFEEFLFPDLCRAGSNGNCYL